uniref:Dendrocyte expressed seven transmembrane protein n=1 Tax=Leptobrachium leishanense TaxID=445787 RepID=A0A8C5MGZ8_9ANUR
LFYWTNLNTMTLSLAMDIFVVGRNQGQVRTYCFIFLCWMIGLAIGGIFFLILHLSSICSLEFSWVTSAFLGAVVTVLAYVSRSARCMALLFILSCAMKKGRNALIAAGTGVVVLNNVKNILNNLKNLAESLTCNLEAKRFSVEIFPIDVFVDILQRIHEKSKMYFSPVKFASTLTCKPKVFDNGIDAVIKQTRAEIQNASDNITSLLGVTSYVGHLLVLVLGVTFVLLGSWLFLRKFLGADSKTFDNFYITKRFRHYDESRRWQNGEGVIPLSNRERKKYISIPSLKISKNQKKIVFMFFIPVFTNIFIWSLLMILDFVVYWLILTLAKHLQGVPPLHLPDNGNESIYNKSIQIHLFEPMCTPRPALSLSDSSVPIGIIIVVLFIFGILSPVLIQVKMLVAASFYPEKDLERIHFLHSAILRKRSKLNVPLIGHCPLHVLEIFLLRLYFAL